MIKLIKIRASKIIEDMVFLKKILIVFSQTCRINYILYRFTY